ncbi:hypothetical protein M2138_001046 [Dysgonomonadaceae bacterium PH5-43]|nr:hypothetical protein [Dysgonomonadaceae bacterium PH5-43]
MKGLAIFILSLIVCSSTYSYSQEIIEFDLVTEANLDSSLNETSGIVYAGDKFWTHNDSGGDAEIYAIDPTSGDIIQTVVLSGAINHDWEDIAADEEFLYIADTGNNINGARTDLSIYMIKLNDIPIDGDVVIPFENIEIIRFYYPEQITPQPVESNKTSFDCEAIYVHNNTIHLFTKDWLSVESGYATTEYTIPNKPLPISEKHCAQLVKRYNNMGFLVTGADNFGDEYLIFSGYQIEGFGAICIKLQDQIGIIGSVIDSGQVEGICFGDSPQEIYITNEDFKHKDFIYRAKVKKYRYSSSVE